MRFTLTAFCLLAGLLVCEVASAAEVDFAHDVVPILKTHCIKCHAGEQKKGGLSLNTREMLLAGGESGAAVAAGKSAESLLIQRITSTDESLRMPPEGPAVPAEKIAVLKRWIDAGAAWERGFTFGPRGYEPPLRPRRVELPPATDGRTHPLDRLIDAALAKQQTPRPAPLDDAAFLRRSALDLIGLLPTPEEQQAFLADAAPDKRSRWINSLLARDVDYAEHWLTFWNDLLRNDYSGTGFITGGRRQISKWLYAALVANQPYDQFARELIAPPTPESRGFIDGIRWRGDVSAGQTVEIQFAQSLGQSFLGINLKCASCHDSFIDRWTLADAYGLAAVYSTRPLDIHRCDKPTGRTASAAWLFPELGAIDPQAPPEQRLAQLAGLMTHPENGRFPRTIVNRLWHRLMGRGIVHPTDAMQSEPWNADLLDFLANDLVEHGYDLKRTLALIATSQAYQSRTQVVAPGTDDAGYVYAGPRARRLTAEQFLDAVWQVTGTAPLRFDAPVVRGKPARGSTTPAGSRWIWNTADTEQVPAGAALALRRTWTLPAAPASALAVVACDNSYDLFVNGQRVQHGENWQTPDVVPLTNRLQAGANQVLIVAKNGGNGPNPAAVIAAFRAFQGDGSSQALVSDAEWEWTKTLPDNNGKFAADPADWEAAAISKNQDRWGGVAAELDATLAQGADAARRMVRASLVKSDFLMRSLGRPNRDQIVSVRPNELTTLEALDLSNGQTLADLLAQGAQKLAARKWASRDELVVWLYRAALTRDPSAEERQIALEALGDPLDPRAVEDLLWALFVQPEFQIVR